MTAADLVLHGARLLTLEPLKDERPRVGPAAGNSRGVMDGFVAVRDGAVVATGHGSAHEAIERVDGATDIDVQGRVVMPGFVDPHTHLCYAGERWEEFASRKSGADYLAVLAAGGGIHATVRATRDASDDRLLTLLMRRIGDAAELGTTTIEVKSGYGLDPDEELRQLRLLARAKADAPIDVVVTYLAAHALPAPYTDDRKRFIREATKAVTTVADEKLAEAVDAFVEKGVFDVDDVRPLFAAAKKLGLAVTMHADQLNDVGGAAFAARTHARSADHVAHASADGIRALARAEVPAGLLPGSAFFVGYPPPEARRFIPARVPVALASDHNPGTSPLEGMPTAIALGVTLSGLTPHEAIVAATINAAHALGRGGPVGALLPRRRADIVVLDTPDQPQPAYRMGGPLVAG